MTTDKTVEIFLGGTYKLMTPLHKVRTVTPRVYFMRRGGGVVHYSPVLLSLLGAVVLMIRVRL